MLLPARGVAALALLYDLVCSYYPLPLCPSCRSTPNHRLSRYSSMRRAQQTTFGKQSAAEQTSLAPHDSKARLRVVTTCRRFMAKPCTPHPITRKGYATSVRQQSCQRLCNAQRVQLFELLSCNGGVKGQSPLRSLGGPRGPFSHVREWPPFPYPPRVWGKCSTTYKWSISAHSTVYISCRCRRGRDRCGRSSGPCGAAFSPCRRRRWRRRCRRPRARA